MEEVGKAGLASLAKEAYRKTWAGVDLASPAEEAWRYMREDVGKAGLTPPTRRARERGQKPMGDINQSRSRMG